MDLIVGTIGGIVIGVTVTLLARDKVVAKLAKTWAKFQAWRKSP